jgi:type II secretory pathway component PulK
MKQRGEQGVVLLLVMVLIAVSISIAYATAKTSAVDVLSARQREHLARAQVLARSGVAIATRALLDDAASQDPLSQVEGPYDAWALLGRQPIDLEDGGALDIQVRDTGAKIGINSLLGEDGKRIEDTGDGGKSTQFLDAALEAIADSTPELRQLNLGDERRGELADAILDWIDSDEDTRMGSPEASAYERADGKPLNRPLFSLDELAGVPGMDPLLLAALREYFSPYPLYPTEGNGGGINPNTAPPHVLALLYYGVTDMRMADEDMVFRALKLREEGLVFCPSGGGDKCVDFATEMGIDAQIFPPLQFTSSVFYVDVEARYQNARACVHSVIDRAYPQTPAVLLQRLDC